jgi:hypothetical protein
MEGRVKPDTDKYNKVKNDWNMMPAVQLPLPVWDLENCK